MPREQIAVALAYESERLIMDATATSRDRPIIARFLATGLRGSEMAALSGGPALQPVGESCRGCRASSSAWKLAKGADG